MRWQTIVAVLVTIGLIAAATAATVMVGGRDGLRIPAVERVRQADGVIAACTRVAVADVAIGTLPEPGPLVVAHRPGSIAFVVEDVPVTVSTGAKATVDRIVVVDPSTGDQRTLVEMAQIHSTLPLGWSPDGRWLAFFGDGVCDERHEHPPVVYLVAADGTTPPVSLSAQGFEHVEGVAWSPDGRHLAVESDAYRDGESPVIPHKHVDVVGLDDRGMVATRIRLATMPTAWGETMAWSPDGRRLAVGGRVQIDPTISIHSVGEREPAVITVDTEAEAWISPHWTGDQLGYIVTSRAKASGHSLARLDQHGTIVATIDQDGDFRLPPGVMDGGMDPPDTIFPSADGGTVLSMGYWEGKGRAFGDIVSWTSDDTNGLVRLTTFAAGSRDAGSPEWSPDGEHIAFVVAGGADTTMWIMDADGANQRSLIDIHDSLRWRSSGRPESVTIATQLAWQPLP